jgi:cytochrome c biogenesis DsbD-like protein
MSTSKKFRAFSASSSALLLSCIVLCLSPLCASAQQNKIIVTPPDPFVLKHGTSADQTLKVTVVPGFHVNGDKPRDEFLIPLKLTWTGPLEAKSVAYPKTEEIKVGKETLVVLTGSFVIHTNFAAPQSLAPGSTTMTGKLRYQACNNEMCFRPSSVEVKLPVVVE